jgi:multidrug efflux pump subunit AcrA (membrane-fusion protein)
VSFINIKNYLEMLNQIQKYSVVLLLFFTACFFSACHNSSNSAETVIIARTPVTVVAPVIKNLYETVDFMAVTTYLGKNTLRSSVTGIVEAVEISTGENVGKGKLLFSLKTLEASALQNSLQSDSGLGFKGVIKIYSPKEGVVSTITHYSGDFVQEGDELAVLSDPGSLVFIMDVPYEMTGYIEKNKGCSIMLPDKRTLKGRIREKLSDMNIQNQTVSYIITPETPLQLPQNLIATVEIVKRVKPDALILPKDAVLGDETQTEFWIMKLINDTTAIKVPVVKGIENSDEVEIVEPAFLLTDRILSSGNYGLADTAAVTVTR